MDSNKKKAKRKHPQTTQITQIFLRGFLRRRERQEEEIRLDANKKKNFSHRERRGTEKGRRGEGIEASSKRGEIIRRLEMIIAVGICSLSLLG